MREIRSTSTPKVLEERSIVELLRNGVMIPASEMVELAILLSGLAVSAITALPRESIEDIESLALLASPSKETIATSDSTLPTLAV